MLETVLYGVVAQNAELAKNNIFKQRCLLIVDEVVSSVTLERI